MSTRGAAASASGKAKQRLVHLLYGRGNSNKSLCESQQQQRTTTTTSSSPDPSSYSYSELRQAYLQQVQRLHPDRYHHHHQQKQHDTKNSSCSTSKRDEAKERFCELQEAWTQYENLAKALKSSGDVDASFTMFGVGCSFSDNEDERNMRAEITDQACRGWFPSGMLDDGGGGGAGGGSNMHNNNKNASKKANNNNAQGTVTRLIDDDLFVLSDGIESEDDAPKHGDKKASPCPRPSLITPQK